MRIIVYLYRVFVVGLQGAFQQLQEALTVARINTGRAERPCAPAQARGTRDGSLNLTIT